MRTRGLPKAHAHTTEMWALTGLIKSRHQLAASDACSTTGPALRQQELAGLWASEAGHTIRPAEVCAGLPKLGENRCSN